MCTPPYALQTLTMCTPPHALQTPTLCIALQTPRLYTPPHAQQAPRSCAPLTDQGGPTLTDVELCTSLVATLNPGWAAAGPALPPAAPPCCCCCMSGACVPLWPAGPPLPWAAAAASLMAPCGRRGSLTGALAGGLLMGERGSVLWQCSKEGCCQVLWGGLAPTPWRQLGGLTPPTTPQSMILAYCC